MIFRFKHWSLFIWTVLATIGLSIYPLISSNLASVHQSHNHSKNSSHLELAQESSGSTATSADTAPLFDNLGNHHYPISTNSELAQRYFDQGLILAYGFNHAEAARAFQEVARLDPNCAMAYWGLAYVLGPNINAPMAETAVSPAWQAIQQAMALRENATAKERALIEALAQRYAENPVADRSSLDLAYANAMRQVAQQYPDDLDIATLFAESLMDTTPWDYWEDNGEPKPEGAEIIAILESVRDRNLDHPGANHLYIHAVEKERPELAVDAADRLLNFAPGAGHLVHMPSHIYIRVGRYHDAVVSNQRGVAADQQYVHQHRLESIYPLVYMPHNHHFLWFAATMSG
jgi:tetratricopeptide (TPR) repeat protein